MIRRTYLDARGETLRIDELYDHEFQENAGLHDLIHAIAIQKVVIEYKQPMSRNGMDGITHVEYEGFYPDHDDVPEEVGDEEE